MTSPDETFSMAFYRKNLGIPVLLGLVTFLLFDLTSLDVWISNLLYAPAHGFVLEHSALFERATHKWPRILPDWVGEGAVIGLILSLVWPLLARVLPDRARSARPGLWLERAVTYRRDFLYVTLAFALSTGVIHYFKSHTGIYCPVETTLYGGTHPKLDWFHTFSVFSEAGDGRCWPGGHASGFFSLLALYFVAVRHRWQHARAVLLIAVALGMVFGTTRVLQGWHYMSHTLWSGVMVWLASFGMALACYGRQALDNSRSATSGADPEGTVKHYKLV